MRSIIRFGFTLSALAVGGISPPAFADPCPSNAHLPLSYAIRPERPCAGDSVFLTVSACGPCVDLITVGNYLGVEVVARMNVRACRLADCRLETMSIGLGRFRAGSYQLVIDVSGEVVNADSSSCTVAYADSFGFRVGQCSSPGLPYVDDIVVGQRVVCVTTPCPDLACPNDSIPVFIRGTLPSNCHSIRRVELVPSDATVIGPPSLRILIDDGGCLGRPCSVNPVPWSAKVLLPPLPSGSYVLPVQLAVASCTDSFPRDSVHFAQVPFRVVPPGSPECPTRRNCFSVSWSGGDRLAACDAVIFPGHDGNVVMSVAPIAAPLAGLQGDLVLDPPGLRIASLAPIGRAEGMHLQWVRTERGARFLLFADHGAPIPSVWQYGGIDGITGWPVLRVTLEQPPGGPITQRTLLRAQDLLGADSTAGRVDECPIVGFGPRAIICSGSRCDMNADGRADVRDLVLMVHCVLDSGSCVSNGPNLDCDGNGQVQLEDVLCCARFILRGDASDTTGVRREPGIGVDLGEVRRMGTVLELPIDLRGAGRVGAARLALSYPADRFDVSAVEVAAGSDWLSLYEVRDGQVVIGLISTSGGPEDGSEVKMVLRLAAKSGQTPAGNVSVVESQFSGRDGVGLAVDLGQPSRGLAPSAAVFLSAGQPNPFSGTTRFSVVLEAPGLLEVGVYDLTGRRVADLFHGPAEVGRHDWVWNGRRGDGSAVPSGVYFLRAAVGNQIVSRRVVLMRDR